MEYEHITLEASGRDEVVRKLAEVSRHRKHTIPACMPAADTRCYFDKLVDCESFVVLAVGTILPIATRPCTSFWQWTSVNCLLLTLNRCRKDIGIAAMFIAMPWTRTSGTPILVMRSGREPSGTRR